MERSRPNILICGTPGTGKSILSSTLCERTSLHHIDVSDFVKQNALHEEFDEEFQTYIVDEDKVVDALAERVSRGGVVVDYHSCDFFPEDWFDLIVVLRTSTEVLFDRLEKRGYSEKKRTENMECEIFQVVLEEARTAFPEVELWEVESDTLEQFEENCARIATWVKAKEEV
eukprot:TRINITY_DN81729_c0_g1_i1.p2 TRINITY_DN81729_c0_g1~~TRINITY_DN81729_c0_g1_i1.p2  ORF type:complete len:172 (+),score=56.51 TRINITY_DN81729_c0_g1_i1:162-677(+)